MRKLFISIAFLMLAICGDAKIKWNQQSQQYINQYKNIAIDQMNRWKIPASITLAQGLLESGAGKSSLARKANNHFGIKCHGWQGRTYHQDDDARHECFRAYKSAYDSYEDHSRFLASGSRYAKLFTLGTKDYKGWARGLKAAGYATNPHYASQLIDIIELYKLHEYDTGKGYDKFVMNMNKKATFSYEIKFFNKNYYIVARSGDSFRSIAKEMKISYRKLAKINERDKNDFLDEGEIVWLKRKRKNAPKEFKNRMHYVKAGESMYTISQKYGIRLSALYKMNELPATYQIRVGDSLKVR
jgi:LysM repeat protein